MVSARTFQLRDGWHLSYNGVVSSASWATKGAAEAQLSLLRSGYSEIKADGGIRHVGSGKRTSVATAAPADDKNQDIKARLVEREGPFRLHVEVTVGGQVRASHAYKPENGLPFEQLREAARDVRQSLYPETRGHSESWDGSCYTVHVQEREAPDAEA